MKVKLKLKERLVLGSLLPEQGSITEQVIVRTIAKRVEITSDEIDKWEIRDVGDRFIWNVEKAEEVEYEFNKTEIQLLKDGVKRLDEGKLISQTNLDLCLKIKDLK